MKEIHIILKGHVTFENRFNRSAGYRYDIPTDELGIPYLPCELFLPDKIKELPSVQIGRARPAGYLGMIQEAQKYTEHVQRGKEYIRSCFTEDLLDRKEGYRVRYLKEGQVFSAPVTYASLSDLAALKEILGSITQIGETGGGITGEAVLSLKDVAEVVKRKEPLRPGCTYRALDYSILLLTPTTIQGLYQDAESYCYIPGGLIRQTIRKWLSGLDEDVICTNAYLSRNGERLLPVPLCISYVKLEKEQIRYRLSPGKDPSVVDPYFCAESSHCVSHLPDQCPNKIGPVQSLQKNLPVPYQQQLLHMTQLLFISPYQPGVPTDTPHCHFDRPSEAGAWRNPARSFPVFIFS